MPKQQKKIKTARQRAVAAQKKRERWTANKLKKLSPDAQALFTKLNIIAKDESITKPVEQKRIKATLKKANKKTIRELKKSKVKLPGVPPSRPKRHGKSKKNTNKKSKAKQHKKKKSSKSHKNQQKKKPSFKPTGYIATLYRKLTTKDKKFFLQKILVQRNLKKREYKKKIESFVHKLKPNLQKTFKDAKSNYNKQAKKDATTVKEKMSNDAKKLFEKILKIQRNGEITFDQEHKQISALIKQTDEKILDEFRNNNVRLFGLKGKPKKPTPEADTKTGTEEKDNDKKTTTDEKAETKEETKTET
ncbi:hypothetical protein M3Y94_01295200 [Aphelenchoides besseyi]|nr:hypothetical protein M3Y94_01295200 [Aphelenchoides besseyi]